MMTIFYIWLGSIIPPLYQENYEQCLQRYGPCRLIGEEEEAELMNKYNRTNPKHSVVQRADILRMLLLQEHGGIFMDLDTQVKDWNYLKVLNCEGQTYFGEEQLDAIIDHEYRPSNWFICSGKNSKEMQRLLEAIDEANVGDVLSYAGPVFLEKNKAKMMVVFPKVRHCFDNTWYIKRDGCSFQGRDIVMYFGWKCIKFLAGTAFVSMVALAVVFYAILSRYETRSAKEPTPQIAHEEDIPLRLQ